MKAMQIIPMVLGPNNVFPRIWLVAVCPVRLFIAGAFSYDPLRDTLGWVIYTVDICL